MAYRILLSLFFALLTQPVYAHPESFHIIVDVSVTIAVQLIIFGVISMVFRGRRCNEALWLGTYGATLVFAIVATTQVGQLYPMWVVPVVLYVLMIARCLKTPAREVAHEAGMRESDSG